MCLYIEYHAPVWRLRVQVSLAKRSLYQANGKENKSKAQANQHNACDVGFDNVIDATHNSGHKRIDSGGGHDLFVVFIKS